MKAEKKNLSSQPLGELPRKEMKLVTEGSKCFEGCRCFEVVAHVFQLTVSFWLPFVVLDLHPPETLQASLLHTWGRLLPIPLLCRVNDCTEDAQQALAVCVAHREATLPICNLEH